MNLEKLLELIFNDPDNISIQYSNINGKEKLIVNGKDLSDDNKAFDDSEIKHFIEDYKERFSELDDNIFDLIVKEAEKRGLNLSEMNQALEQEHYTEEEAINANNVITVMSDIIAHVIKREIDSLYTVLEKW